MQVGRLYRPTDGRAAATRQVAIAVVTKACATRADHGVLPGRVVGVAAHAGLRGDVADRIVPNRGGLPGGTGGERQSIERVVAERLGDRLEQIWRLLKLPAVSQR
jgi:hypothetical protein